MGRGEESKKEDPQDPSGDEVPGNRPPGSETELPQPEAENSRRDGASAGPREPDGQASEDGAGGPQGAWPGVRRARRPRRAARGPTVHLIALPVPRKWRAHFLRRGLRPFPREGRGRAEERRRSPPPPPPPPPSTPQSSRRPRVPPGPWRKRAGTCALCQEASRPGPRRPARGASKGKGGGPARRDPLRQLVALVEAAGLCRCSLCLMGFRFQLAQLLVRQVPRCHVAGPHRAETLRRFRAACAYLGRALRGRGAAGAHLTALARNGPALRLAWAFRCPGPRAAIARPAPPEPGPPGPEGGRTAGKRGVPRLVLAVKLRASEGRCAYTCPSCQGRVFSSRAGLRDHLRACHTWGLLVPPNGSDPKPFLCPRCGQGFRFFCQLVCHRCSPSRK
ncbi:zinc finger protein ZFPM1-like [Tachyglossus aculeatus]|uniref:zinc finger protein ZFPM1-like n=1 Tax=Tachyglossus aculeatus TaxID=9261 RepID=UPI0018F4779F|nr:zinc finger protein ZFPM1-like [Tachyglossus aculeatus]